MSSYRRRPIKLIEDRVDKWRPFGLTERRIKFIFSSTDVNPGTNSLLIKTHKHNNPARGITSGCGTPTENLSLFVEQYCKLVVESIKCRIKDTTHMLGIVDNLNEIGIQEENLLVSFDIVNMFPSINNKIGVERVRKKLMGFSDKYDLPVGCII